VYAKKGSVKKYIVFWKNKKGNVIPISDRLLRTWKRLFVCDGEP
jgi:hypothetical protein